VTRSSRSSSRADSYRFHASMADNSSSKSLSWPARILAGALIGGLLGAFYPLEFTVTGLLASMAAGAAFFSIIGLFGGVPSEKPGLFIVLVGIAGGVAGLVWAKIIEAELPAPVIWGAILGVLMMLIEMELARSSKGRTEK